MKKLKILRGNTSELSSKIEGTWPREGGVGSWHARSSAPEPPTKAAARLLLVSRGAGISRTQPDPV